MDGAKYDRPSNAREQNWAWYRRTEDLVPLFDPKVHLFEYSLLKILAQLQYYLIYLLNCMQPTCIGVSGRQRDLRKNSLTLF